MPEVEPPSFPQFGFQSMPRYNIYDRDLIFDLGGQPLLDRCAAKQVGGNGFADGRAYEIMFITRMIIHMAHQWFSSSSEFFDPFDISEGLECLVDDLMTRRGDEVSFYQIKSGRVDERPVLKSDFVTQQKLDELHGVEADYYLVVTPAMARSAEAWIKENDVPCVLWTFPFATGLLALLPLEPSLETVLEWMTGSKRPGVWIDLHDKLVSRWLSRRDYAITELFEEIVNQTRYRQPPILRDDIRRETFHSLLEYYEIYTDLGEKNTFMLRSDRGDIDWFCVVPCTMEVLNEFDQWFSARHEVSTGEIMMWLENYIEELETQ
ncbi:hypothetical protein [Agrobacterium tumefaciens]|uniref:hypothetical protein n=1 Tax=Agrobacterium tumefaciens TaxID=358 RepID=UPI00285BFCE4|nr:hypothetical protein [Agrobacterium tumefaciens]MDR6591568.1 hypothetical protein [Agrobacterium tumefaciens]